MLVEYVGAIAVRCHAWNTVSRSGVGSTVDPKIETLNIRLLRLSQGGSLVPEGTVVSPEGRHAGGLCEPGLETDSRQTVTCAPERAQWLAVGQLRAGRPLLEES